MDSRSPLPTSNRPAPRPRAVGDKRHAVYEFYCTKCAKTITGGIPRYTHLACVHQALTNIRFKGRGEVQVKVYRSPATGQFHCPRCTQSFLDPKDLQEHAGRDCPSLGDDAEPHKPKGTSMSVRSAGPSHKRIKLTLPATAPPLTVPTEGSRISRIQRALARKMSQQQLYTTQEIAQFLKCESEDVHYAVQNQPKDDLDEDMMYLQGLRDDLLNADRAQDIKPSADTVDHSEARVVDEKRDMEELVESSYHEDDGQDELDELEIEDYIRALDVSDEEAQGQKSPRRERAQRRRLSPTKADNPLKITLPARGKPAPTEPAGPPLANIFPQTESVSAPWPLPSSTSSSASATLVVRSHSPDPVELFLSSLKRPCGRLTPKLREFGITTGEDLDALCVMKDHWKDVEQYFLRQGMTPFEWLMVQDGLTSRAAALATAGAQ